MVADQQHVAAAPSESAPNEEPVAPTGPALDAAMETHEEALAEMEDRWRRALADLDNVRARYERELDRVRALEQARVAAAWLPVVDNLELALQHASADPGSIVEGVRAVRDMAVGVLAGPGFPRQDEVGVPFDPVRHEALGTSAGDTAAAGTVVRVLRPGYGDGDGVLRPAGVVVAMGGGG